MKTNKPTYEELEKRLTKAEEIIRTLQDRQADSAATGTEIPTLCVHEELYRSIVVDSPGMVCRFLPDGEIVFVNAACCEYFGKTGQELVGSDFTSLIPEQDRQTLLREIQSPTVDYPSITHEHRVIRFDGRLGWQCWTDRALFDEQNRPVLFQSFEEDITEQKQKDNELRLSEQKYRILFERAMDAIFIADVKTGILLDCHRAAVDLTGREKSELIGQSHEILHPLQEDEESFNEVFRQHLGDKHGQTFDARIIAKAGEIREVTINGNLLEIEGKPILMGVFRDVTERTRREEELRKLNADLVPSNIDEVIEDAVEINHAALKQYAVDLRCELADLPRIHRDKQRVLQILVNLITNAKQALGESEQTQKVLSIRSYRHGENALRVDEVDNRIGISKENMPRMFTHAFTTKKRGHGFGLHSSALAAREMGGSLTVDSEGLGHGATFTLELPLNQSEALADGCSNE
ncbi:MAG: PAS domain S-box protein [Sedimentisphaerales bacterium]|nr:PAS domain S-box protein [Sedimentisphaerales bacterium]